MDDYSARSTRQPYPSDASQSSESSASAGRNFVGIPGLENVKVSRPITDTVNVSAKKNIDPPAHVRQSFARQGFIGSLGRPDPLAEIPHSSSTTTGNAYAPSYNASESDPQKHKRSKFDRNMEVSTRDDNDKKSSSTSGIATGKNSSSTKSSAGHPGQGRSSSQKHKPFGPGINAQSRHNTQDFKTELGSDVAKMKENPIKVIKPANQGFLQPPPSTLVGSGSIEAKGEASRLAVTQHSTHLGMTLDDHDPAAPRTAKSPLQSRVKLQPVSPSKMYMEKLPRQEPTSKLPARDPVREISEEVASLKLDAIPRKPSKPPASDSKTNASNAPKENVPPSQNHPSAEAKLLSSPEPKRVFTTVHRDKYRAIRSLFTSLANKPKDKVHEDQLFRRLADAVMDEDAEVFERTYTELLSLAVGV